MPKIIKISHCFTELFIKNKSGTFLDTVYFYDGLIAECPAEFTYTSSVRGCYKVLTSRLDWWMSGLECQTVHSEAHLLVINDTHEQAAVTKMLESTSRQLFLFVCFVLFYFLFILVCSFTILSRLRSAHTGCGKKVAP